MLADEKENHSNGAPKAGSDIGLIGLAVMGQNLILNMAEHGYTVTAYNRTTSKARRATAPACIRMQTHARPRSRLHARTPASRFVVSQVDDFLANEAKPMGEKIVGAHSVAELMGSLKKPRRVMLLVKAGAAVDAFIDQIVPHTEPGDIIIDGGNSLFADSARRCAALEEKGLLFVGTGVSGGEEGARHGPSIMPGGSAAAWPHVKGVLQAITAKAGKNEPCCQWVGGGGAGHYVKMVHNGIEYGDMQARIDSLDACDGRECARACSHTVSRAANLTQPARRAADRRGVSPDEERSRHELRRDGRHF